VYVLIIAGNRNARIIRLCAEAQRVEQRQRAAWQAHVAKHRQDHDTTTPVPVPFVMDDGTKLTSAPPLVWGVTPPAPRTVEKYIAKARAQLAHEGGVLAMRDAQKEALGLAWARINDLYGRALAKEKYTTCERLIRLTCDLFGVMGAIKFTLSLPTGDDAVDLPVASQSPEAAAQELAAMLANARERALKSGDQRAVSALAWLPMPKTNGAHTNGGGTNGAH
jgi:hypothetical protein